MEEISEVLAQYPSDCRPTHVEPRGSGGGLSGARFWRLVAPRGTLALRRWPVEHPTADGLRFIHAALRHAANQGVAILPVPVAASNHDTFVQHGGHFWELAPWLPGAADFEKSRRIEKLRAAMTALAEFHNAVAKFPTTGDLRAACAAPAITSRLTRLQTLQSGGIDELAQFIDGRHWPEFTPLARQFVAALPAVIPPAIRQLAPLADLPFPLQPSIRDIWHDHVLFDGDRVTGLIDFGAMQIDTPATDVARLLGSLVGDDDAGWSDGVAVYTSIRQLSNSESLAVPALDRSGTILAGCNWIRWIFADQRTFENREQIMERFRRLSNRVSHVTHRPLRGL